LSHQVSLALRGAVVAKYLVDDDLPASLSPRPYLHPVTTMGGTVVTACRPPDHEWHLGAGLAIQDVGGVNFWGGPTYVRDRGYIERDDHGRIEHVGWRARSTDRLLEDLKWFGPDGVERLGEERSIAVTAIDAAPDCWALHFSSSLRNTTNDPLHVGSPATNGRAGAGYGGFFWRLPPTATPWRIFTADGHGEDEVHGTCAPWLSISGRADGSRADYTLVFVVPQPSNGEPSTARPWFVRSRDYPGVCSAVAFDRAAIVHVGERLEVRVSVLVADGSLDPPAAARLVGDLQSQH
jgi:hypothetical protein